MKFRAAVPFSRLLFLYVVPIGLLAQIAPNSDNNYKQLRNIALQPTGVSVQNVTLKRDASTFQLNSGVLCFVAPVNNRVTGAVFVGEGKLLLDPPGNHRRVSATPHRSATARKPRARNCTTISMHAYSRTF